jgi:AcrR family transcriptional regulator
VHVKQFTFADRLVKPINQTNMSTLSESEQKILDAAKKVFETYGYFGARMQQIADEAGISKASLHYYFRSKEKLFDHIFDETMAEFMPLVSVWEDDSEEWEEKLRTFITTFFSFLKTKSMLFIIREINRNPNVLIERDKKSKGKNNRFLAYFDKLQKAGKIKDIDARLIFILMHSLCAYPIMNNVFFKLKTNTNDKEYEVLMNQYTDFVANFLIHGIKK